MKTRILTLLLMSVILIGISSCSKSSSTLGNQNNPGGNNNGSGGGSGGPGANEVWMQNTAFNPSTRTVTAGTTVTWTNKDAVVHDVTSDTGLFASGNMAQNATFSFTFITSGTYNYHCTHHTGMNGVIIVQ